MDEILEYYQLPEFLLKMKISDSAKIVYTLLYNRCRLSVNSSGFYYDGKVYCFYTADDLAEKIGRTKRTVLSLLDELKTAGLLEVKKRGRANMNFIKVPAIGEENFTFMVKNSSPYRCRNLHHSNYKKVTSGKSTPPNGVYSSHTGSNTELVYNEDTGRYEYRKKEPD